MQDTLEVQELSLEKVIDSKLVQNNVTDQVIAALKEKYGGMKLKALDDKESYLEIKVAARECGKVRTLAVKVCKEGREDAIKTQKLWVAKEKEVVGKIAEVENELCAEIDRFDAEVDRKVAEEKRRQEEAYINRQATLTRMGATYKDGSFVLGEASFEAELVKGMDEAIWTESVVPKYQAEYDKLEAVKVAEENRKREERAEFERMQEEMRKRQEEMNRQMEEIRKAKEDAVRIEREKELARENEMLLAQREADFQRMKEKAAEEAEAKRIADIEAAVKKEQERQAEEARVAELKRQQEEAKKAEEFAQSKDKVKWEHFIAQVNQIEVHDMRSGQYRKKMQIAKEKLDEILSL